VTKERREELVGAAERVLADVGKDGMPPASKKDAAMLAEFLLSKLRPNWPGCQHINTHAHDGYERCLDCGAFRSCA
jgi:hypothetical protein